MSALEPREELSVDEIQRLYPRTLKLQLVQVFLRHGERAPVSARFESVGLAAFWPYCSVGRKLLAVTMNNDPSNWKALQWNRQLETFDSNDKPSVASGPLAEIDNICNHGELTDQGRKSAFALGARLRCLYIDQLRFMPSTLHDPELVYLRTTRIPRALESLQEAFVGMYPHENRSLSCISPRIVVRAATQETLAPNYGYCKRLGQLAKAFERKAARKWNDSPDMDYINHLISKWMPEDSKRVALDSNPKLSGIYDTINSTLAHGPTTKLPEEFYDPKGVAIMDRILQEELFGGFDESREFRMLGVGSLMGDIVYRMATRIDDGFSSANKERQSRLKFGLSGCHDTTIAGILTSLGAFKNESWPQYSSHIAVELFQESEETARCSINAEEPIRHKDNKPDNPKEFDARVEIGKPSISPPGPPGRYYVRIRYNDKPITIPGCRTTGNHLIDNESFCTYEAFKDIVDKFTPTNWRKACRSNLGAEAFPTKPEPAGY